MSDRSPAPGGGFMKKYFSGTLRAFVVSVFLILQFAVVLLLALRLWNYGLVVYYAIQVIGTFTIIGLINNKTNPSFKIGWLALISLVPIGGLLMYTLWGRDQRTGRLRRLDLSFLEYGEQFAICDPGVRQAYDAKYGDHGKLVSYLENQHFPLYKNNRVSYFSSGEAAFESVIEDLKKAERFIFLDFFIVAEGALWERIKPILLAKAAAGIEIKFLYDDFGSMKRTDSRFWRELNEAGIESASFNPVHKYMDKLYMNYRSHQKIIVVDGSVAYTGGFNLADEYVNELNRFGHWKDGGIRIEGDGSFGLTCIFLEMWGMASRKNIPDFNRYKPDPELSPVNECFCQSVSDGPENNPANPILSSIKQMIYSAEDYFYITTPYLIIESDLAEALTDLAQSGVDVRIVTPAIPDKKLVFQETRHNYGRLLAGGVRIYEYTPGFIHAKTYLTKGLAFIGTTNFDYRSLYLHYECGTMIYDDELAQTVRTDIEKVFEISREISLEEWKKRPLKDKAIQMCTGLFSNLL